MKITQINGYTEAGSTKVDLTLDTDLSVAEAISSVLALFAGERGIGGTGTVQHSLPSGSAREIYGLPPHSQDAAAAEASVTDEPAKVTRPRRPRTNPDAAGGAAADAPAAQDAPTDAPAAGVRRRRTVEVPAADAPKVITDADLTKAASNAAAIIGTEVVQAVLDEFKVGTVSDIAPELREKFLGELDIEIDLAKKELAKAGA